MPSTGEALRTPSTLPITLGGEMSEPTIADVDALVGPATPQFAYQLRARVRELVAGLPEDDPVRRHAEEKMELLDRLGYASSKAHEGGREPRTRPGWETLPSAASADQ
jgi:DNA polymerase IIIc chi subunit